VISNTNPRKLVGIQGGRGSFNEEAALTHLSKEGINDFELRYLHTTSNVIRSLENHEIDLGQFAVYNTLGGNVEESLRAAQGHSFCTVAKYTISIAHALMIAPQAHLSDIDTIMAHPQVFRQCKNNLSLHYSSLKLVSGEDELIDPAKVAELLARNELPKNIAVMGSTAIATAHGLNIVAKDLQDAKNNCTTFILVALESYGQA
jgi:prephenate dehydratase